MSPDAFGDTAACRCVDDRIKKHPFGHARAGVTSAETTVIVGLDVR